MSDNQKLLALQNEYIENGSISAWSALWLLSIEICKKMLNKEAKKHAFRLSHDDLYDKSIEAAVYVLRRYKTRPGYRINKTFIGALHFGVVHALWYKTDGQIALDRAISLDTPGFENCSCMADLSNMLQ